MTTPAPSEQDSVVIFDTTLRDGEQSPGATMTHEEKLEVAELLDAMGVDVIEAGFPIASEGDFHAVHEIAKRVKNAAVCEVARKARGSSTSRRRRSGRLRANANITFISTSPVTPEVEAAGPDPPGPSTRWAVVLGLPCAQLHRPASSGPARTTNAPSMISSAAASRPRSRPAPPRSTFPAPSLLDPRKNISGSSRCTRPRAQCRPGALLRALSRRSRHGGGDSLAAVPPGIVQSIPAPSTASASGPATLRSKRLLMAMKSATTCCRNTRTGIDL